MESVLCDSGLLLGIILASALFLELDQPNLPGAARNAACHVSIVIVNIYFWVTRLSQKTSQFLHHTRNQRVLAGAQVIHSLTKKISLWDIQSSIFTMFWSHTTITNWWYTDLIVLKNGLSSTMSNVQNISTLFVILDLYIHKFGTKKLSYGLVILIWRIHTLSAHLFHLHLWREGILSSNNLNEPRSITSLIKSRWKRMCSTQHLDKLDIGYNRTSMCFIMTGDQNK